jgi:hypothetical protein
MKFLSVAVLLILVSNFLGCDNSAYVGNPYNNPYDPLGYNYPSIITIVNNGLDNFDAIISGGNYSTDQNFPLSYSDGMNGLVIDIQTADGGMGGSLHLEFLNNGLYLYSEDISNEGSIVRSTKIAPYIMPDKVRIQTNGFAGKITLGISAYGHHI